MDCLVFVRIMNDLEAISGLSGDAITYVDTLFGGMPPPCPAFEITGVHALNQGSRRMCIYRARSRRRSGFFRPIAIGP